MQFAQMTSTKSSVRAAAKASKPFLDECFQMRVADELLLMRLALVWSSGMVPCYPEEDARDVFATLSPADWGGLAVIECAFAKLSREHSIDPDEHERGVARFLEFALSIWDDVLEEEEPRLYHVAQMFDGILESWLDDPECEAGCSV
jgi:hypothetical protein